MYKLPSFSMAIVAALLTAVLPAAGAEQKKPTRTAARAKTETLMLKVEGVQCAKCAKVITDTLHEAGLKVVGTVRPNTRGPSDVEITCPAECDLGAAAAKINEAQTPHRSKVAPALALQLFAKLDEKSAKTCMDACRKIEGVDGKSCKCDSKTGEMELKITGEKKVTAPQILLALKDAGIEAHTMKTRVGARTGAATSFE